MKSPAWPAGIVIIGLSWLASSAQAGGEMARLWSLTDDDLARPIGSVVDVAVDASGVVGLLDVQNQAVFRIAPDGKELPPIGRQGEGPGEFLHPALLAPRTGGGCLVVQDFYSPVVCLDANGKACPAPDVSVIRDRFAITQFTGARSDNHDRLLVVAMTTARMPDAGSPTARKEIAWSIFRIGREDPVPSVLFSDRAELCEENTVRLKRYGSSYTDRCWDINSAGQLLFADPDGRYRVTIGHPADGAVRTLDLPAAKGDDEALRKLASSTGTNVRDLPRIAALYWVNERLFLVKPMAGIEQQTSSRGGTFELFDADGKSHGRSKLNCSYDPDTDQFFLRNGMLVIIEGGKAAADAALQKKAAMIGEATPSPKSEPEVIRIHAHDLAACYDGHPRFK